MSGRIIRIASAAGMISGRIVESIYAYARDMLRRAAPATMMTGAMIGAFTIGKNGGAFWWLLLPMIFGGFALGAAEDRAEARASTVWASKFWRLIETDHILEILVTHTNAERQDG